MLSKVTKSTRSVAKKTGVLFVPRHSEESSALVTGFNFCDYNIYFILSMMDLRLIKDLLINNNFRKLQAGFHFFVGYTFPTSGITLCLQHPSVNKVY